MIIIEVDIQMNSFIIEFSPTGGVDRCASSIAEGIGLPVTTIDLTDRNNIPSVSIGSEDIAIFAFPAYGGRVPSIAMERMKGITGNGTRAIIAAVYGNREFDDTIKEAADALSAQGFAVVAACGAVAEHSLIRSFGEGRPDESDKKELVEFGKKARDKHDALKDIPGSFPYKVYNGCPAKPITDDKCISCGLCYSACPAGAISENDYKADSSACISCMRCIKICPAGAKTIDKTIESRISEMLSKSAGGRKDNRFFL